MMYAKPGDRVRVHYKGTLKDGTVFSSTYDEKDPFEFTVGEPNLLPSFNNAVIGMREGEKKVIVVTPEKAYGEHKKEFVFTVERDKIPENFDLKLGKQVQIRLEQGSTAIATVKAITHENVVLDANEPLAGKTLTFEIEMLKIL